MFWNIYLFLSLVYPYVRNICIFLSTRLFLTLVIFISFYHCKKNLCHIVFPFRSFVSNLLIFKPLSYVSQFHKYITLLINNILNLSLTSITLKKQHVTRLEPYPCTHPCIAKRLVCWGKVEHEITVKKLGVAHEIHFVNHVYSSTIFIQLFLSLRQSNL